MIKSWSCINHRIVVRRISRKLSDHCVVRSGRTRYCERKCTFRYIIFTTKWFLFVCLIFVWVLCKLNWWIVVLTSSGLYFICLYYLREQAHQQNIMKWHQDGYRSVYFLLNWRNRIYVDSTREFRIATGHQRPLIINCSNEYISRGTGDRCRILPLLLKLSHPSIIIKTKVFLPQAYVTLPIWRSCLGPLVNVLPKLFKLFGFSIFRLLTRSWERERTWFYLARNVLILRFKLESLCLSGLYFGF